MYELTQITAAIGTVGFPIVAYLMMFRFSTKVVKENTQAINDLRIMIHEASTRQTNTIRPVEENESYCQ